MGVRVLGCGFDIGDPLFLAVGLLAKTRVPAQPKSPPPFDRAPLMAEPDQATIDEAERGEEPMASVSLRAFSAIVAAMIATTAMAQAPAPAKLSEAERAGMEGLRLARAKSGWDEPVAPFQIVGPLFYVGTRGLGAYLFVTRQGLILLNTGTPQSCGPIQESIRRLGYDPKNLRYLLNSHAHFDHDGAFACLQKVAPKVVTAIMAQDVPVIRDGGRSDFAYGAQAAVLGAPPARVDRILRDGDTVKLGDVVLRAHLTPGHTRGSTTWETLLVQKGRRYSVVFPDGTNVNPGYRLVRDPSYPGIADDYRMTFRKLEALKPDIALSYHTEFLNVIGRGKRSRTEGVKAFLDAEDYRRFVANRRALFDDQIAKETNAK
jgi:metallo-beta-lactamase class B